MKLSNAKLNRLMEEATVDAYSESEQRVGFLTMIDHYCPVKRSPPERRHLI